MKHQVVRLLLLVVMLYAGPARADAAGELIDEMNLARTNPGAYVEFLEEWKERYTDRGVWLSDSLFLRTHEDVRSVDEAIEYMKKRSPMEPLTRSEGLDMAAKEMVGSQGPSGQTGHRSPDGLRPADRTSHYGNWRKVVGENIVYGLSEPRNIVIMWIVDDGVPGREHRDNIFNKDFKVAGAALGPHKAWRVMCVVDFSGGFDMSK